VTRSGRWPRTDDFRRLGLSVVTGQFLDEDLERAYVASVSSDRVERFRLIAVVGVVFFLGGVVVDPMLASSPVAQAWMFGLRVAVAAILVGVAVAVPRLRERPKVLEATVAGAMLLAALATCMIIALSPGELLLHAVTVITVLMVFYLYVPVSMLTALLVGLVLSGAFFVVAVSFHASSPVLSLVVLYLTLVNVIGAFVVRQTHMSRRREYLVLQAERSLGDAMRSEVEARAAAEQALAASEARHRTLVEMSPDAILVQRDGIILYVNPAGIRLMGAEAADELVGHSIFEYVMPDHHDLLAQRMLRMEANRTAMPSIELQVQTADDRTIICEVVSAATLFEEAPAIQSVIRDISVRKGLEEELTRLATTDPLTGIANRRSFFDRLETEWARARRHTRRLSLLTFDIDHFKRVNDAHGHASGDAVLMALVAAAQSLLRVEDTLARLGGEEFAVILPEVDREGARVVGERLRERLAEVRVPVPEGIVTCTVSVGVAQARPAHESPDRALQRADDALYAAKEAGRNTVIVA
jgi:diguanylate cyclase (GGDEF)-like protein/PAS domain S-box-containing protein